MAEEHTSSDDEAPEEVALSVGKAQASSRRKRERTSQIEQRQLAKQGKKRQSRETSSTPQSAAAPATISFEADDGDLPDEVIESLARDHQHRGVTQPDLLLPNPTLQPRKRRRRLPVLQKQAGPVIVEVLNSSSGVKPSDAAVAFAHSQLRASKQRSVEMLRPAQNWSCRHRAVERGTGPALFFVRNQG